MFRTGQIIETTSFRGMIIEMFDIHESLISGENTGQYSIVLLSIYNTEVLSEMVIGECLYKFEKDLKSLEYLVVQEYGSIKYLGGF